MRINRILIGALASIALTSTAGFAAAKKHIELPEAHKVEKPDTHKNGVGEATESGTHESGKESHGSANVAGNHESGNESHGSKESKESKGDKH